MNSLSLLTPLLNSIGQQRLVEFLDAVDVPTAAQFRAWLSTASETEVRAAADSLNRSSHGRDFAGWWRSRGKAAEEDVSQTALPENVIPQAAVQQAAIPQPVSSRVQRPYRETSPRAPTRSVKLGGIPFIALGIVLGMAARGSAVMGEGSAPLSLLLTVVAVAVYIGGCMKFAESKGHSKWMGLVGLLTCIGLLILLLLPNRYKAES